MGAPGQQASDSDYFATMPAKASGATPPTPKPASDADYFATMPTKGPQPQGLSGSLPPPMTGQIGGNSNVPADPHDSQNFVLAPQQPGQHPPSILGTVPPGTPRPQIVVNGQLTQTAAPAKVPVQATQVKIGSGPHADMVYNAYLRAVAPKEQGGLGMDPTRAARAYRQAMASMTESQIPRQAPAGYRYGPNGNLIKAGWLGPNQGTNPTPMTPSDVGEVMSQSGHNALGSAFDMMSPVSMLPQNNPVRQAVKGASVGLAGLFDPLELAGFATHAIAAPKQSLKGVAEMPLKAALPSTLTKYPTKTLPNGQQIQVPDTSGNTQEQFENIAGMMGTILGGAHGLHELGGRVAGLRSTPVFGGDAEPPAAPPVQQNVPPETALTEPPRTSEAPGTAQVDAAQTKIESPPAPSKPTGRTVDASGLYAVQNWRNVAQADLHAINQRISQLAFDDKRTSRTMGFTLRPMRQMLQSALETNTPPEGLLADMAENHRATYGEKPFRTTVDVPGPDLVPESDAPRPVAPEVVKAMIAHVEPSLSDPEIVAEAAVAAGTTPENFLAGVEHYKNEQPEPAATGTGVPGKRAETNAAEGGAKPTAVPAPDNEGARTGGANDARQGEASGGISRPPVQPAGTTEPGGATTGRQEPVNAQGAAPTEPGAAAKPEVVPPPVQPEATGLAHQVHEREAAGGAVKPIERGTYRSLQDLQAEGQKAVGSMTDAERLVSDLESTGRNAKPEEITALLEGKRLARKAVNDISDALSSEHLTDHDRAALTQALHHAQEAQHAYLQRVKPVLTRAGESMYAIQAGSDVDTGNYADVIQAVRDAKGHVDPADMEAMRQQVDALKRDKEAMQKALDAKAQEPASASIRKVATRKWDREALAKERGDILKEFARLSSRVSSNPLDLGAKGIELVGKLAINLAKEGLLTLDELTAKVNADLKPMSMEITKDDLVHALNEDAGKQSAKQSEVARNVADVRRQARIQKAINDMHAGVEPPKPGKRPEPENPETRRLMAERDALIAQKKAAKPKAVRTRQPGDNPKAVRTRQPGDNPAVELSRQGGSKNIDELHEKVKQLYPDVSREEVVAALQKRAGKPLSTESKNVAEMRKQAALEKQVSGLDEQIASGNPQLPDKSRPKTTPSADVERLRKQVAQREAFIKQYIDSRAPKSWLDVASEAPRAAILGNPSVAAHIIQAGPGTAVLDELSRIPASIRNYANAALSGGKAPVVRGGASLGRFTAAGAQGFIKGLREVPGYIWHGQNSAQARLGLAPDTNYGSHGLQVIMSKGLPLTNRLYEGLHSVGMLHGAIQQPLTIWPGIMRSLHDQAGIIAHNLSEAELQKIDPSLASKAGMPLRVAARKYLVQHPTDDMLQAGLDQGMQNSMMGDNKVYDAITTFRRALKNVGQDLPVSVGKGTVTIPSAGKIANAGLTSVLPVVKPTTNVGSMLLGEYSPVGIARSGIGYAKNFLEGTAKTMPADERATLQRLMDRGMTGTAIMGLGTYLYRQGLANGRYMPGDQSIQKRASAETANMPYRLAGEKPGFAPGVIRVNQHGLPDPAGRFGVTLSKMGLLGDLLQMGVDKGRFDMQSPRHPGVLNQVKGAAREYWEEANPFSPIVQAGQSVERMVTPKR
jgi:hypothetical protein